MKTLARRKYNWKNSSIVKWIVATFYTHKWIVCILLIYTINYVLLFTNATPTFLLKSKSAEFSGAVSATTSLKNGRFSVVFTPTANKERETFNLKINSSNNKNVTLFSNTQQKYIFSSLLCLGIEDIFIALFLILLILTIILGNILVVLSVFLYKRMRTFNNFLLTSLATADLLVGLLIMPLSLIDLLHNHNWPFSRLLCQIWATCDVMLCTASILNLCIISLDRYMAITSPLKYPRTRSRIMAFGLLFFVWGVSMIVCSPPWFISEWGIFFNNNNKKHNKLKTSTKSLVCAYSPSVPYRIYSAMVSFYIPLMVMLSVYFKIFRVASEREHLMCQGLGTCRLSRRVEKTQRKYYNNNNNNAKKFSSINNNCYNRSYSASSNAIVQVPNQHLYNDYSSCTNINGRIKKMSNPTITNRPILSYRKDLKTSSATTAITSRHNSLRKSQSSCSGFDCQTNNENDKKSQTLFYSKTENNKKNNLIKSRLSCGKLVVVAVLSKPSTNKQSTATITSKHLNMNCNLIDQTNSNKLQFINQNSKNNNNLIQKAIINKNDSNSIANYSISSPNQENSTDDCNLTKSSQWSLAPLCSTTLSASTNGSYSDCVNNNDKNNFKSTQSNGSNTINSLIPDSNHNLLQNYKYKNLIIDPLQIKQRNSDNQHQLLLHLNRLQPVNLLAKAQQHYQTNGPGKNIRGSKEKIVYLRERKALKTIGIVVLGFIICWMPFFVVYLLEVFINNVSASSTFKLLNELFLWLGYSNSVLNPIIYTMYNGDFRRCFRDLLGFGCVQHHRRTMSVKKLHQQSTVF